MSDNIYHRFLNLPFELKRPKILNPPFPDDYAHYEMTSYFDSDMQRFLRKLNLTIGNIEAFYTPPGGKISIHCDESTLDNHVKINTTWGPEEGRTRWWKCENVEAAGSAEAILSEYKGASAAYRQAKCLRGYEETCEMVYEASTNRPSLINVGQMHSTYNPTDEGRWTLCFVPCLPHRDYIFWSEAMHIFKDYIVEE